MDAAARRRCATEIPVNATVPAVAAASVPEVLARFDGCRTAKVKVAEPGQRLADDVARVRAVREALGAEGRIRVDANGALERRRGRARDPRARRVRPRVRRAAVRDASTSSPSCAGA